METDLRKEFDELRQEILGETHAGEPWTLRVHHVVREASDVVAIVLKGIDDENKEEDVEMLKAELIALVTILAASFKVRRQPLVNIIISSAIPSIVNWLVDSLAAYGGTVDDWIAKELHPRVHEWALTLSELDKDFAKHA